MIQLSDLSHYIKHSIVYNYCIYFCISTKIKLIILFFIYLFIVIVLSLHLHKLIPIQTVYINVSANSIYTVNKKLLLKEENKYDRFNFLIEDNNSPFETFLSYYPNMKTRESILDRLIAFLDFVEIDKKIELDQRYNIFVQNAK